MSSGTSSDESQSLKYGLTSEDVDELHRERRELVEWLVRTPDGRSMIKEACPDIDSLGRVLNDEIADLGRVARSDDVLRARAASVLLNEIVQRGYREATNDLYSHGSLYLWAQDAHLWFDRKIRARTSGTDSRRRRNIAERWGWYGNALTFMAALVLAVSGSFSVAALLILARIIITAIIWSMASFPADDSPDKPVLDSDPRICVLGHGGDLLLFASFGYALVVDNHPVAGFLVVLAGWIMILGTIFRIGASASSGYRVPRLHLERMVRGFSTCAAIALAAIPSITWWWPAVVMISLPTFFAWIEGREAWKAMKLKVAASFDPSAPSVEVLPMEDGAETQGVS